MGEESGKSRSPQSAGRSYSGEAVPERKGRNGIDNEADVRISNLALAMKRDSTRPTRYSTVFPAPQSGSREWIRTVTSDRWCGTAGVVLERPMFMPLYAGECYETYAKLGKSRGNITWRSRSEVALSISSGARECYA
jgi:hypothetical protein